MALQVLAVAGETLNKAGEAAAMSQTHVPKNFQRPKNIRSYAQYLKYAGQASGILPVEPEADSPSVAPGPSAGTAQTPETPTSVLTCCTFLHCSSLFLRLPGGLYAAHCSTCLTVSSQRACGLLSLPSPATFCSSEQACDVVPGRPLSPKSQQDPLNLHTVRSRTQHAGQNLLEPPQLPCVTFGPSVCRQCTGARICNGSHGAARVPGRPQKRLRVKL